ncbi:MAG: hypothetical protein SGPRY_011297, partial [Prymnesium sp.]
QAWRYNGGKILRALSLLINGKRYEDPKDPGQARRKQESNFFITINSDKSSEAGESYDVCVRHMEQMLQMLSTETAMANYFKFAGALNLRAATFDDLRGAILDGVDLTGVDLGGKDLSAANLANANLSNAKLSNANVSNANLSNTNLSRARLDIPASGFCNFEELSIIIGQFV